MLQQIKALLRAPSAKKQKEPQVEHLGNGPLPGLECAGASREAHKLTEAENNELRITVVPRDSELDHANTTPHIVAAALARARQDFGALLSDDDAAKVAEMDQVYKNAREFLMAHSDDKAIADFKGQYHKVVAELSTGETGKHSRADYWTKEDFLADYANKRKSAKRIMRDITLRVQREFCAPIVVKVQASSAKLAAEREAAESKQFAEHGLVFKPSAIVLGFRKLATHPQKCLPGFVGACAPSVLLEMLEIKINTTK